MEHTVETVSPTQRKINVSVPAKEVNAAIDATVRNMGRNLSLDGFRKGKVPSSVIEKRFHEEIIGRSNDTLVNTEIQRVMEEQNLRPVSRLDFDGGQIARDSDYSFSVSFEVLPDIELPEDLDALSVEVESPELDEGETSALMERLQKSMGTLEPVTEERVAQFGDVVVIDVEGEVDGEPVPGMKTDNFMMQLAEPKKDDKEGEVEAVIRTLKVGEEGEGVMTLSEDHPDPAMRGKEAKFKVRLKTINKEILPPLDDELAKKMGFDSLDKFRQAVLEHSMNNKILEIKQKGQQKLLDSLLDKLDFPLPESMVTNNLNAYLANERDRLMRQGLDGEQIAKTLEGMREEGAVQARMQTKSQAYLMALAINLGIRISQMDVDRHIRQIAMESNQDYAKLRDAIFSSGMANDLEDRLMASRALDIMYGKAKKIVLGKDGKPLADEATEGGEEPATTAGKTGKKPAAKKAKAEEEAGEDDA